MQLIVLCDGTNGHFSAGKKDSHVVVMTELLRRHGDPTQQTLFYHPGVGSPGGLPGVGLMDHVRSCQHRLAGLAFGRGVFEHIEAGYGFLMQHWKPGDEIWLFGFSRGAFTARGIAGMLNMFGLLEPQQACLLPGLIKTYFSANGSKKHEELTAQARDLFGRARPVVHFVGTWDTVSTIGVPPFHLRLRTRPTVEGKRFRYIYHALALDEPREQFTPRAYAANNGNFNVSTPVPGYLEQMWFRGVHTDIGGGNQALLACQSRISLAWMVSKAAERGLHLNTPGHDCRDEAQAMEVIQALPREGDIGRELVVNNATHSYPWWALTGLTQRDTRVAELDGKPHAIRTSVHPSATKTQAPFPRHTVWASRGWVYWAISVLAMAVAACFAWCIGRAQLGDVHGSWNAAMQANNRFQLWQVNLLQANADWVAELGVFAQPCWALVQDFGLILTYAVALCPMVSWSFAHAAGWNHFDAKPRRMLNALGWCLPLAVVSDLLENGLSLLAIHAVRAAWTYEEVLWPLRALLLTSSTAKWVGLVGVVWLGLWGAYRRMSPRRAT